MLAAFAELLDISYEEYDGIDAVRWSELRKMIVSPKHYKYMLENPKPPTAAQELGNVIHGHLLESGQHPLAICECKKNRGSKAFADESFERGHHLLKKPVTVVTQEELTMLGHLWEGFASNEYYETIMLGSFAEKAIVWTDPETGIRCKCRIDLFTDEILTELKSTGATSEHSFVNEFYTYHYHAQLAFYTDALFALDGKKRTSLVVSCETKPCFDVAYDTIDDTIVDAGREIYKRCLRKLNNCIQWDTWPGKCTGIREMPVRQWAIDRAYEEEEVDE